jgi:hypothetical protein
VVSRDPQSNGYTSPKGSSPRILKDHHPEKHLGFVCLSFFFGFNSYFKGTLRRQDIFTRCIPILKSTPEDCVALSTNETENYVPMTIASFELRTNAIGRLVIFDKYTNVTPIT